MVGAFWSKALLALWEEETDPSAVRCGKDRLSCCLIVGIHASGISIPLSLLMLLGWSLMWIASLTLREYQWGSRSINLINFVQQRIIPGLIGVFRNSQSLSNPVVLFNPFIHAPSRFTNVYFAAFTRNLIHYSILFSWILRILRNFRSY